MGERVYRGLLFLLPRRFRQEAAAELVGTFHVLHARARRRGRLATVRFWLRTIADVLVASSAERLSALGRRRLSPGTSGWLPRTTRDLLRDVDLAMRRVARSPAAALTSSGTLALGLAASTVAAVLARDVLMRPLPFPRPDELVRILEVSEGGGRWWPSFPNAADWREHASFFRGVGIADIPAVRPVLVEGAAVRAPVSRAARGLFETLGVQPSAGRFFTADEQRPGGPPAAVVSDGFWRTALAGRPLDGLAVMVGLERYRVVGVLPRAFRFLGDGAAWTDSAAVWTPMDRDPNLGRRTSHGYHVVARLGAGITLERARAEMQALARRLKAQHGEPTQADGTSLTPLEEVVTRRAQAPLSLLLAASAVVLLVTVFNLAAAILAQGIGRARELSVRLALGATRGTLVRHLLSEAGSLAIPGTILGLVAAGLCLGAIRTLGAGSLPRLETATLDLEAAGLAFGLALVTACAAGVVPAFALTRPAALERLRGRGATAGGREARRVWTTLLVVQVTLTVVLLSGSGLLLRSFVAALDVDLGYDSRRVLAIDVTLPESRYREGAARLGYYDAALARLRSAPGIAAAGLTSVLPHVTSMYTAGTSRGDSGGALLLAGYRLVDDGYFEAIGIGRLLGDREALRAGQAIVDRRLQQQLWRGANPIGDRVTNSFSDRILTVGGVVRTVREWQQGDETTGAVYVDYHQRPDRLQTMALVVRYDGREGTAVEGVRQALAAVDPLVPVTIEPLAARTAESLAGRRLLLAIAIGFAAVALLLSAAGVYTIASFTTAKRRREAAIRLALGAQPTELGGRVMLQAVLPALAGIAAGLGLAIPTGRAMQAELFQVGPADPVVLAAAAIAAALGATAATIVPARRAARVDPAAVLRDDRL